MIDKQTKLALAQIPARWTAATELAQQWRPGMLRSAWTMPLEMLVQEQEHLLRTSGGDPETIKVPKSIKADANEKALPAHVRNAYRRGVHLQKHLETVQRKAKKSVT